MTNFPQTQKKPRIWKLDFFPSFLKYYFLQFIFILVDDGRVIIFYKPEQNLTISY